MVQKITQKTECIREYNGHISCPIVLGKIMYFIDNGDLYEVADKAENSSKILNGPIRQLKISTDHMHLSFCMYGDIYLFNTQDRTVRRLTYFEENSIINAGWYDEKHLLVTLSLCRKRMTAYKINIQTLSREKCYGDSCTGFAISKYGNEVVQIWGYGYEGWKKYQGGTAATLWFKGPKDTEYKKLLMDEKYAQYNCYSPVFIDERLFFLVCDDSGAANIHEYVFGIDKPEEGRVIQKTFHNDFCVLRNFFGANEHIAYTCGGKPYLVNINSNKTEILQISHKPIIHMADINKTLRYPYEYVTSISTSKTCVALAARGHIFTCTLWSDVFEKRTDTLRYKHAIFIDNDILLCVRNVFDVDAKALETIFEIRNLRDNTVEKIETSDCGTVDDISLVHKNRVLFTNHLNDLYCLDVSSKNMSKICSAPDQDLAGFDLSPDGKWATYSIITSSITCAQLQYKSIYIHNIDSGEKYRLTKDSKNNEAPTFSTDGEYIWYISNSIFKPEYDEELFNLYYRNTAQVCVIPLNRNAKNPLDVWYIDHNQDGKDKDGKDDSTKSENSAANEKHCDCNIVPEDFDYVQAFYMKDPGTQDNRISYIRDIGKNTLLIADRAYDNTHGTTLRTFNIENNTLTSIAEQVTAFNLSNDLSKLIVITEDDIKIGKPTEAFSSSDKSFKKGGVLSLPTFFVDTLSEYQNIFDEAWWYATQRFWDPKILKKLDWDKVYDKYNARISEIRSKDELNMLLQELCGELQTSHAFLINRGDIKYPSFSIGHLGISYLIKDNSFIVDKVMKVDQEGLYPEAALYLQPNDIIKSVNGQNCTTDQMLEYYFIHQANKRIHIEFIRDGKVNTCYVKLLDRASMRNIGEKLFAENNRKYIYAKTNNSVGYIYIPDMQVFGFEFFTRHLKEALSKDVIIIDLRYNAGGHTSSMIFKLLSNVQTSYGTSPGNKYYRLPYDSHTGKLVFICNQMTASDGDIAAQHVKHLGYELIGMRTWGGVIGIHVRDRLIDNTMLSYPEYSTMYPHLDRQIENYGVEPTKVVDQNINHMIQGSNPQLDAAIVHAKKLYSELEDWQKSDYTSLN